MIPRQQVSSLDAKLDKIYRWFKGNLKDQPIAASTTSGSQSSAPLHSQPRLTFAVWIESPETLDRSLCCPSASFYDDWLPAMHTHIRQRVFQCHCNHSCHLRD